MATETAARAGVGVKLRVWFADTLTTISGITELQATGANLGTADATHLDSPDRYSEYIPILKTPEQWTFTIQYNEDDETQARATGLWAKLENRIQIKMRVDLTGVGIDKAIEVEGYVAQLGNVSFSPDQVMTRQVTFQPSGRCDVVDLDPTIPRLVLSLPLNSQYLPLL